MTSSAENDAPVHGIDRHTQDHLCGTPSGLGTDALAPAMPITCSACRAAWPNLREGDCWLCTHPVLGPMCSACGCLAHYPPWPATSVLPPVVSDHPSQMVEELRKAGEQSRQRPASSKRRIVPPGKD